MFLEILLILVLTGINGLLAMSELAVVSSRPARLQSMAEKGDRGAQVALDLLAHPGKLRGLPRLPGREALARLHGGCVAPFLHHHSHPIFRF